MRSFKKYISIALLLVFSCLLLPPAVLHSVFADHHDTVCDLKHEHGVTSVEALHTHCDIFTTNAPLYDAPQFILLATPLRLLLSEVNSKPCISFHRFAGNLLPARAPPVV